MGENPLQNWINTDSELNNLLAEIDSEVFSEFEKAKIAFHKLSDKYNLPKYPDNINEKAPISMYEVLGKLKFVENISENLKSNVLYAAYLILNKLEPEIDDELEAYLKDEQLAGFGYKGEDVDVEMIPIKVNESWFDKGCIFFTRKY